MQGDSVTGQAGTSDPVTARQMIDMIHDLGQCHDARQIVVASLRHFRYLFGDFNGLCLLVEDAKTGSWRTVALENPYRAGGRGLKANQLPEQTDFDRIAALMGQDASWVSTDTPIRRVFVESEAAFVAEGSVVSVRLGMFTGLTGDIYWAARWVRSSGAKAWCVLGFDRENVPEEGLFDLYQTAVETTSRLSLYPSLVQSVAHAERVNHSLRRNLVHDLKTPITVIKGYGETLALEGVKDDPEMFGELLGGVLESCDRLLEDVKDIIEPMEGEWQPKREEFDLSLMLQKVVLAERHTGRSRGHQIEIEGCDQPVLVSADRRKLMRVVENLLSNAVKYSPGLGKVVTVRLREAGDLFAVEVRDEGLGLSADQIQRVLRDCERVVDEGLGIEGSGFGLNSCQMVLRAHGGELQVESQVGVGSVFRAVLRRN